MAHGKKKKVEAKQQELKAKKTKASAPVSPATAEPRHSQPRAVKEKQQKPKQPEPKAKKATAPALPAINGKPRRGQHRVVLEENMTIYMAAAQKVMLLEALVNCQELDLDLSQVSEMDTAGFQLLLLLKREAMKADKEVRLTAHSQAVTQLLDLYNMAGYFGDPLVIPASEHAAGQASR